MAVQMTAITEPNNGLMSPLCLRYMYLRVIGCFWRLAVHTWTSQYLNSFICLVVISKMDKRTFQSFKQFQLSMRQSLS